MTGTLLTFNLDANTDARLRAVCQRLDLRVRPVLPTEYGATIGALAGIPTVKAAPDAPRGTFKDPMMVICNLLSPQLDALLQGMREEGVRIDLKCVLTPSNVGWNAFQLHGELAREHEAMRRSREKES